jgi:hypothetical protein
MQRCGDLMQRESLMTNSEHRKQTSEMAMALGAAFEELSKATGSVAHLYKNLEIGPDVGQVRVEANSHDPMFEALIKETRSVGSRDSQGQA